MMKAWLFVLAGISLCQISCSTAGKQADSAVPTDYVTNLDAESRAVIAFPEFQLARLSPDGKYIAISHLRSNFETVSVMERATQKVLASKKLPKDVKVTEMLWITNERIVVNTVYSRGLWMKGDKTNQKLYAMDFNGARDVQLFPEGNDRGVKLTGAAFGLASRDLIEGELVLISEFKVSRMGHELFLKGVNILNGQSHVVDRLNIDGSGSMGIDNTHIGRVAFSTDEDELVSFYAKDVPRNKWRKVQTWPAKNSEIDFLGFNKDNTVFYFLMANKETRMALYSADLDQSGKMSAPRVLFESAVGDLLNVYWDRDLKEPVFADFGSGRASRKFLSNSPLAQTLTELGKSFPGETVDPVTVVNEGILLNISSGRRPNTYYIFDKTSMTVKRFLSTYESIDPTKTAIMERFAYPARDRLNIEGFIYKPANLKPPYPTIFNIHGGPYGVTEEGDYSGWNQFLVNKGYAVVTLNYRGSGGRGRSFMEEGYKKWGTAMQDDIADAANFLVKKGLADRERIGIWGGSYGGYAAAMSLLRFPEIFKCAFAVNGVYDLRLFGKVGDTAYGDAAAKWIKKIMPNTEDEKFRQSPVSLASTLKCPLYLVAGADDERVPIDHAYALKAAVEAGGKTVQFKEYPNTGHWFRDQDMLNHAFSEMLAFFETNLKPVKKTASAK